MKLSLVVLTYNGYDMTHQLLMDIKNHAGKIHEVIVVNNASEDSAVMNGLGFWLETKAIPLRVFHLSKNRGFSGGMNYGLKKATGDVIGAISNDVQILSSSFYGDIETIMKGDGDILLGPALHNHDTGWNKFGDAIIPYVEAWFVAAKASTWEKVDYFDENYNPHDFEDVDLSMKVVKAGGNLVQMRPNILNHLGGKTIGYSDERVAITKKNREFFQKKWEL